MNLRGNIKEIVFFTKFELMKIIRQGQLYTGMAILISFVLLCCLGAQLRLYRLEKRGRHLLEKRQIEEVINSVSFSTHCLPSAMDVLFPILLGIFTAAVFAGEFELGRIRTLAMRPISRTNLFLGKYIAMCIYALFFWFLLWSFSLLSGIILFNFSGDVYIWSKPFHGNHRGFILPEMTAWGRYFLIYIMSFFPLMGFISIFMAFSVIFKKFTPAASIPTGIYFVSFALENMPYFKPSRIYLPTFYFSFWKYVMHPSINWKIIIQNASLAALFAVVFMVGGIYLFKSADI